MRSPPRSAGDGLITRAVLGRALAVGLAGAGAVLAVQGLVQSQGWTGEWARIAALGSLIATNVAMLVWFRRGGLRPLHSVERNASFAWLVAALTIACGVVLVYTPLSRQFGLPVDTRLQVAGWSLLALGLGSAAWRTLARARLINGYSGTSVSEQDAVSDRHLK